MPKIKRKGFEMKLYVAVTKYECYDCAGDRMYFQRVLGVFTSIKNAREGLDNAYEKLHEELHPWTRWCVYEVSADDFNFKSFDFENRYNKVYSI